MTAPENPPEYNPNIPTVNNNIAESQEDFLGNFRTLFDAFGRNHIDLDDATNPGNHSIIELIEQSNPLSTDNQEVVIYSKDVPGQTTQLFMRYPRNGKEFQLSQYQIYELVENPTQTFYFTFLPGGIIVYFGFVNPNANPFTLQLIPALCKNIMGVNLCVINPQPDTRTAYPSNPAAIVSNGIATGMLLTNSLITVLPPPQFYLIFGNI